MSTTATGTQTRTTWAIDPAHTHVAFAVKHLMISTVRGRFTGVTGTVHTDEADPSRSDVEIEIDATTIDTREPQRDGHLKSPDFLDVEKFPKLTFRSTRVSGTLEQFKLTGDLTIHGVTKPVTLDVTAEGQAKDPWGGERAGFTATTSLKRSDFGLNWNQVLEAGGLLVGDEVKISIDAELLKK
jgi:polyisoprenoid-binding protein YceI